MDSRSRATDLHAYNRRAGLGSVVGRWGVWVARFDSADPSYVCGHPMVDHDRPFPLPALDPRLPLAALSPFPISHTPQSTTCTYRAVAALPSPKASKARANRTARSRILSCLICFLACCMGWGGCMGGAWFS